MVGPMGDDLAPLIESFGRSLRARNRSPKTQKGYLDTARLYEEFLLGSGHKATTDSVSRAMIEDFVADQLERWAPSTAATRYRCLQQFVRFLLDEGELDANPMAHTSPPSIGEAPVPVLTDDELRRLLAIADGKSFTERRDSAIIRVFIDTGVRLAEMASMSLQGVDLQAQALLVVGKGDRARWAPLGDKATLAVDRYLRRRRQHAHADLDALWLGPKGGLTDSGITQMLRRTARAAGVDGMHPHRFRHTMAHRWLAGGGQEGDLQQLAGWRSPQMLARYGASAKAERARDAHRRMGLGDVI